jgi:hypothetical protein
MRAGVAKGGLISPVLFSLYANDMPSPSHHVELALYADDTAIIATSRKSTLLVSYLESYFNYLQRWLCEWRIAINVSNTTRYLGVTLYTRLTWSPHIDQVRKRAAQRLGMLSPLLNRKHS